MRHMGVLRAAVAFLHAHVLRRGARAGAHRACAGDDGHRLKAASAQLPDACEPVRIEDLIGGDNRGALMWTAGPTHVHRGVRTSSGRAGQSIGSVKATPGRPPPAECTELSYLPIPVRLLGGLSRRASSPRCSLSPAACSHRAPQQLEPPGAHARLRIRAAPISRASQSATVSSRAAAAPHRGAQRSAHTRVSIRPPTGPP